MEVNTATLRGSAPQWSLAGDKQLLDILNNIHQSLVTRCQEVNRKLDEMVTALDGASIDLQNVNNKFMALSNSQFIESRVYDDDVDIAAQETPKETPKPAPPASDITRLKQSVATLVAAHETIEILASDSEDDDDDEASCRVVLKPRDLYAHRPLPHIIGSQPWRSKWHAGLHPEDSDSDSSMSKRDLEDEEYSDSEPEVASHPPAAHHEREESTASSELPSEQDIGSVSTSAAAKPSPSDIAAELARRLGGNHIQIPIQEPEYAPPIPASRKVYRAEQPAPGTIFSDEPPPLDDYQSEESDSPEDDIFAELHKNKPYVHSNREQSRLAEDLFAGLQGEEGDVFSDFRGSQVNNTLSSTPAVKQKSTLFEDESEPELFAEQQVNRPTNQETAKPDVENTKKPIGAISLFGNTQGAESIGAAILRRNRRKPSTDDDATEEVPKKEETQTKSQEKDIFDDLFAKSEREQKRNTKKTIEQPKKELEKQKPKIDLFSDNIFDDIDDIFTTSVTKSVKKDTNSQKSLFDDDEDIFSDIAVTKTSNNAKVDSKSIVDKNKSIFDSDDDLFSENTTQNTVKKETVKEISKVKESNKGTKSNLFENEDDDIFTKSDIKNDNLNVNTDISDEISKDKVLNNDIFSTNHNDNLTNLMNIPQSEGAANKIPTSDKYKIAAKSIFDDDDENDDLFGSSATKSSTSEHNTVTSSQTPSIKSTDKKSLLFDDDSDENDLFGTKLYNSNQKSINNNEKSQNYEIKPKSIKQSSALDGLKTDNNASKKFNVKNIIEISSDLNENKTLIKPDTPIDDRKQSVFDDEEESLFGESNRKLVQDRPKPELLKKPTMIPKNSKNGSKKLDNIKNIDRKDHLQENIAKDTKNEYHNQENVTKDIKQESIEKITDISEKTLSTSKRSDKKQPLNAEHDKVKLSEEKIESKLSLTKENTVPIQDERNPEFSKEQEETKILVIEEKSNPSKLDSKFNKIEPAFPETDLDGPPPLENIDNNNDDDIFGDKPNDFSTTSDPACHSPNVFDDIFSEPPAFEKSKEPKKSKNINALFDDDSDDEASFFKKNDPVLDDKPDLSPDVNREALFGIFHDEPPAIEVDFTQKPTKSNINDDFLRSDSDDDLFGVQNTQKDTLDSPFESSPKLPESVANVSNQHKLSIPTQIQESINEIEKPVVLDQKPQIDKPKPPLRESQRDGIDSESKKVGKLKTMNFNIDVSTLLPGASPKKKAFEQLDTKSSEDLHEKKITKKSREQTDGQMFAKSSEDLHSKEKIEPLMVKSVSFEGDPDSQVLDNKISKERAKIQVKRRPSTRRARKEAVKKSAIDFGDDSTDNSSSLDDPPKRKPNVEQIQTIPKNDNDIDKSNDNTFDFEVKLPKLDSLADVKPEIEEVMSKTDKTQTKLNINLAEETLPPDEMKSNIDLETNSSKMDLVTKVKQNSDNDFSENTANRRKDEPFLHLEPETKDIEPKSPAQVETKQDAIDSPKTVTSKIVYILNDEDIFSTPAEKTEIKPRTFDLDDDDDLFKSEGKSSKNSEVVPTISTLGNTYKGATNTENNFRKKDSEKNKKSLFDDLSDDDDELFNKKNKTTSKPKSILDSDSEEDLFGGRKKKKGTKATVVKESKEIKKVEAKSSLFGDEDDYDLFGAKVKSNPATSPQPMRSTREVATKPAEAVFDDPLSMLGDYED